MKTTFKRFLSELDYKQIDTKLEYHSELNPKLWQNSELDSEVLEALKKIASEFIEFLAIPPSSVVDVIITGSNCSFNYSSLSDVDLHLVIDEKAACPDCPGSFIDDCFRAKKNLWNKDHNIKIKGYDVELYAQPKDDNLVAAGVFSVTKNQWIKKPISGDKPSYDDTSVKLKAAEIMDDIDSSIDDKVTDVSSLQDIKNKIKKLRQSGLETGSEFGIENLVFKTIRNNGYLDKLDTYMQNIQDADLSLN